MSNKDYHVLRMDGIPCLPPDFLKMEFNIAILHGSFLEYAENRHGPGRMNERLCRYGVCPPVSGINGKLLPDPEHPAGKDRKMDLDLILGIRSHIRIGSHVPGTLKFKFGLAVMGNSKVLDYVRVNGFGPPKGQDMPGVRQTRFNPLTRCMTMVYDKDVINPELLHRLFISKSEEEFEAIAKQLAEICAFDLVGFCQ
jgi:hypothetical protein